MHSARILLLGATAAVVMAVAAGSTSRGADPPDDRAISAGSWDVVAVEWDGIALDRQWLARLQVVYQTDGSWAVLLRRIPVAAGRSTTRQDVAPKTFEMETLGSEGIEPSRFHGIYRLDGDTRVLCIVREGLPRPDDFSAPRKSNRMLVTLKRAGDSPATARPRTIHLCHSPRRLGLWRLFAVAASHIGLTPRACSPRRS